MTLPADATPTRHVAFRGRLCRQCVNERMRKAYAQRVCREVAS